MDKQNKKENEITTTHSIYLEFILQDLLLIHESAAIKCTLMTFVDLVDLYCEGHIQMTINNSNINVETETNTLNKITTTHSICSEFILGYSYKMV